VDSDIVITFAEIPAGAIAKATFGSGTYAPATITGNTVTIAPAQLTTAAQTFTLDIIKSTAEPYILYSTPAGPGVVGPLFIGSGVISFTPAASELVLVSTNLYVDRDGIQQPSSNTEEIFAGSAIEFVFSDLPTGVVVVADLNNGAIPVTVVQTANTITVTPVQLKRDTAYTLGLKILSSGSQRTLYQPPANATTGIVYTNGDNKVLFHTATIEALADLLSTNLYIDPVTQVDAGAGAGIATANTYYYFATDDDIVLTFGSPIPAGAVIDVQLRDARYNLIRTTATPAGSTLTINPVEDLNPSATYYLSVNVVDTTNTAYWTVPAATISVAYTANQFPAAPMSDTKYYIGFSTQKDQVARLVSTNLYLNGNPANYNTEDGPYFQLGDAIVLTFADVPDGTRISKAILALTANAATGLSVYSTLATDAVTGVTTVTIAPNAPLDPDETYYLQLALSKTIGADPVWSVTAANGANGIHGPTYVEVAAGPAAQAIAFETITTFKVVGQGVGSSLTNITNFDTGNTNANFDATGDIIIEFDRPIATVTKAQLRYFVGAVYYGTTVSADDTNLSADKKVLTIRPTNLLAPNATFKIRLDVTSVDGQQIVYDSTDTRDPSVLANQTYFGDLQITVDSAVRLTGISKAAASAGSLALPAGTGVSKTDQVIDVSFTPTRYDFAQFFNIYARRFDIWDTNSIGTIAVPQGSIAPVVESGVTIPGGSFDHFTAEGIVYRVRGISNAGYAAEATSPAIGFAP
jgi:hypothetical protein